MDDSESMSAHWKEVQSLVSIMTYVLNSVDEDGVDLHFSTSDRSYNSKRSVQLLQNRKPQGIGEIEKRLVEILERYSARLRLNRLRIFDLSLDRNREEKLRSIPDFRPLTIYVLTGGLANTDPASSIRNFGDDLETLLLANEELVRIQFISFGLKRLEETENYSLMRKLPMDEKYVT